MIVPPREAAGAFLYLEVTTMKEVKSPKKPMAFYYIVVLALILLFNEMARPYMEQAQIVPVDYSTFMQSIDDKTVDHVEIQ